ncbi:carbonic anhydrase 3 [Neodiprion pinetum]|uniref:Carbonic anhydrase 3-like n=1 Tax=Neodiprion lecontei TaxID=441921 RepID=A0A6J0CC93_NEOLC|nr:carbonic anhydrase 3-like [Neodiprion lecontei]XP_046423277.1 carbonic anhydrase 3-like [Neodiprion fabricii]XP_046480499.1 carbonic anhydrase 3-like [Neodiprion pinetum]
MFDISLPEFLVVCGSVLLIALLLTEILDWTQLFAPLDCQHSPVFIFGYADHNGPHTWKLSYPESGGSSQSPVNIVTRSACVVQPSEPLKWRGYSIQPVSMTMANDGNNVLVCAFWTRSSRPSIQGGPLNGCYDFYSMMFHWGPSDVEGSEHTLDYVRYPMELQMIHVKRGFNSPLDAIVLGAKDGVMIISFFFQITNVENPYLDHIVTNLWRVSQPGAKAYIPPFPLEWMFPPFEKNYYTYNGSLTQPPCSEIVTWIIQPEPIAISSSQVAKFRKLCSLDGPILLNSRPVQKLNDRSIYLHE